MRIVFCGLLKRYDEETALGTQEAILNWIEATLGSEHPALVCSSLFNAFINYLQLNEGLPSRHYSVNSLTHSANMG